MVTDYHANARVYRSSGDSAIVIKLRLRRQSEEHYDYKPVSKQLQLKAMQVLAEVGMCAMRGFFLSTM